MPISGETLTPCPVLIIAAEDAVEQTIKPRCITAGCDESMVRISEVIRVGNTERPIVFPEDFNLLESEIQANNIGIVIIYPLLGFLSQTVDSHKDQSVRLVLHELKLVADRTGAAVIGLRHLTKGSGANPLYRGMGSIAITAAARSVLTVDVHPHENGLHVLATTKINIAAMPKSITYAITALGDYPVIKWGHECDLTAADLGQPTRMGASSKIGEAIDFLQESLAGGWLLESRISDLASDAGISESTLKRAKKELNIRSGKYGFQGAWMWALPGCEPPKGAQLCA